MAQAWLNKISQLFSGWVNMSCAEKTSGCLSLPGTEICSRRYTFFLKACIRLKKKFLHLFRLLVFASFLKLFNSVENP
jgi:hypothetical protein